MYQINKPYVYVMIYNSSLPISEDHLPHLTNPFYKVNSEGFGLGLSIVKNIMASHQGNIFIKNHQKGVEITLRFNNE
jgi:signal transduction histidine kinase